jgi:hypothetical protein
MLLEEVDPCVAERDEMAKKKAAPASEPEPKAESRQKILLVYKIDERLHDEFKEWLDDLAKEVGAPLTVTFDIALKELGKAKKLRPMPRRLAR